MYRWQVVTLLNLLDDVINRRGGNFFGQILPARLTLIGDVAGRGCQFFRQLVRRTGPQSHPVDVKVDDQLVNQPEIQFDPRAWAHPVQAEIIRVHGHHHDPH